MTTKYEFENSSCPFAVYLRLDPKANGADVLRTVQTHNDLQHLLEKTDHKQIVKDMFYKKTYPHDTENYFNRLIYNKDNWTTTPKHWETIIAESPFKEFLSTCAKIQNFHSFVRIMPSKLNIHPWYCLVLAYDLQKTYGDFVPIPIKFGTYAQLINFFFKVYPLYKGLVNYLTFTTNDNIRTVRFVSFIEVIKFDMTTDGYIVSPPQFMSLLEDHYTEKDIVTSYPLRPQLLHYLRLEKPKLLSYNLSRKLKDNTSHDITQVKDNTSHDITQERILQYIKLSRKIQLKSMIILLCRTFNLGKDLVNLLFDLTWKAEVDDQVKKICGEDDDRWKKHISCLVVRQKRLIQAMKKENYSDYYDKSFEIQKILNDETNRWNLHLLCWSERRKRLIETYSLLLCKEELQLISQTALMEELQLQLISQTTLIEDAWCLGFVHDDLNTCDEREFPTPTPPPKRKLLIQTMKRAIKKSRF